jgi:hypothetical protein
VCSGVAAFVIEKADVDDDFDFFSSFFFPPNKNILRFPLASFAKQQ